jgi:hypothetical protein
MGLGLISFFLFVILVVTGVLLMFYYVPSTTQAYDRMLDLRSSVAFGVICATCTAGRRTPWWPCLPAHVPRVLHRLLQAAARVQLGDRRHRCFLLTLLSSFTGYLLPWDQLAFWAITVGTSIAGYAPFVGKTAEVHAAGRRHRGPGGAAALLRAARRGAAGC